MHPVYSKKGRTYKRKKLYQKVLPQHIQDLSKATHNQQSVLKKCMVYNGVFKIAQYDSIDRRKKESKNYIGISVLNPTYPKSYFLFFVSATNHILLTS